MGSRFVISGVCVAAVAFACGPRSHNEAATQRQTATLTLASMDVSPRVSQQGSARMPRTPMDSALTGKIYVTNSESHLRLALHVINTSKKRVELRFPSGQTYDFAILDSVGREVWRWGRGRMFTQSLRNKLLSGGESLEMEEQVEDLTLAPGRYTARATLTSQNYPIIEETEFTVGGSAIASR
jgi:hypothetical protein